MAKPAAGCSLSSVFFDALQVKIRGEGTVRDKAIYLALDVRPVVSLVVGVGGRSAATAAILG